MGALEQVSLCLSNCRWVGGRGVCGYSALFIYLTPAAGLAPALYPPGLCRLRSVPLCAVSTAYVPILHPELEWSVHWSASPTACEQLEVWGLACPSILEPGTELGTEEYQRIMCRVSEEKAK